MELLKQVILEKGDTLGTEIVKVDNFLNHQIDVELIEKMGEEFYKLFSSERVTKVLTVEASGIAIAYPVAKLFKVPLLFAKKGKPKNIGNDVYSADVYSFTKDTTYGVFVSKKYLGPEDSILIIDDFLANGQASIGLINICEQAGAKIAGIGIAIEKQWQRGSDILRKQNHRVESLAIIEKIENDRPIFAN